MLTLYTSNRLERLSQALATWLSKPIAAEAPAWRVLEPEIVVVQSRGMSRWVSLELARHHGILANVSFPFPNTFVEQLMEGIYPEGNKKTPFLNPGALTWAIMDRLGKEIERPEYAPLAGYLKEDATAMKRYQLSRRIAGLFDQYPVFRPEMIRQWESGGAISDPADGWQPILWRSIFGAGGVRHRAHLLEHLIRTLRENPPGPDRFPRRVSVFGISYLPPVFLDFFEALSRHVAVDFFLMNPCEEYWGDIRSERAIHKARLERPDHSGGEDLHLETGNRLLSSMGALGREFFDRVAALSGQWDESFEAPVGNGILHAIQSDILYLRDSAASASFPEAHPSLDASLQIHSCHSPMREVQVLHDHLLEMFQRDPDLTAGDVMILTPDIDLYAPYVEAVFETRGEKEVRIPFSIADRSLERLNASIRTFFSLLDLRSSRMEASRVAALLACDDIRKKFGFSPDEIATCTRWIRETAIRWGQDSRDRQRLGLPGTEENTWAAGIRRLLLGYALAGEDRRMFMGVLPYDHVEGSSAHVLDRFLSFLDQLKAMIEMISQPMVARAWRGAFQWVLDTFIASGDETDERTLALLQTMDAWVEDLACIGQDDTEASERLGIEVVRAEIHHHLSTTHREAGFLSGGVTFCTLLPMRAIPFKVIGLLGMNMDGFPRKDPPSSFDLMAKDPRPGDRSSRKDDKYLFLETVLSARQILYISFVGQSMADNTSMPPSVLVSELIDTVVEKYGIRPEDWVVRHRLQPFSPAYFTEGERLVSYSEENLAAARALSNPSAPPVFIDTRLPAPEAVWRIIDIDTLIRFFSNPARFFLRNRLGVVFTEPDEGVADQEPFSVDNLSGFQLGSALLENLRSNGDMDGFVEIHRQRGFIPHGGVGEAAIEGLREQAKTVWDQARPMWKDPTPAEPFVIDINGFTVTGTCPERHGGRLVLVDYGKLNAKRLLRAWIYHLAIGAVGLDEGGGDTVLICRDKASFFKPVAAPADILETLLSIYWEGLQAPLWFFPDVSMKAAKEARACDSAVMDDEKVRSWWRTGPMGTDDFTHAPKDPYILRCFGSARTFDTTFFDIAAKVFKPLLDAWTSTPI